VEEEHRIAVALVEVVHLDASVVEAVRREGIVGNRVDGRIFTGCAR
jgi:hypothetical protein